MSVHFCLAHAQDEVLDTDFFVDQLKKKWPEVEIRFLSDPRASIFQFVTTDEFGLFADFWGTCVWYMASGNSKTAQFALWYRSVIPADWQLRYYDSGLYFDPMLLTSEITEQDILAGFNIPLDISKYE